jgi:hypothetical protein
MYCWYLQYESKNRCVNEITFEIFVEIFPSGFPSEDGLGKLWDEQKVDRKDNLSDNLLDYPNAGLSLFKTK